MIGTSTTGGSQPDRFEMLRRIERARELLEAMPPPRDLAIHPDDLAELQALSAAEGWPRGAEQDCYCGVHLIPDPTAPRLPRARS